MSGSSSCPACGSELSQTNRFCPSCGSEQGATGGSTAETVVVPASMERITADRLTEATTGEFEILERVGHGAMGSVYLARDVALSRRVAIKVISPQLLQDASMVARFRLEAQTVAALRHPNIVSLYGVREIGDLHFFIMDFIDGPSLRSLVKEHGPLDVAVAKALLFQIGSALSYAHRRGRGVIHRDVKPANVMVDREGNAVVMDFGISKVGASQSGLTQTGATIGTPEYMSPEQCMDRELSGASDQYALGIVAYEMLTGAVPFKGSSYAIMMAHAEAKPGPIREHRGDCPPEVEASVMRMLAKDPADRFADVEEAISAMGGKPLGHRDPVRNAIVALVDSVSSEATGLDESSPLSPLPASRKPAEATPTAADVGEPVEATPTAADVGEPAEATPTVADDGESAGATPTVADDGDPRSSQPRAEIESQASSTKAQDWAGAEASADAPTKGSRGRLWIAAAAAMVIGIGLSQAVRMRGQTEPLGGTAIRLETPADTISVGDDLQLTASVSGPEGSSRSVAGAIWRSSDTDVVAVDGSGLVFARMAGLATISVRLDDVSASVDLWVRDAEIEAAIELPTDRPTDGERASTGVGPADGEGNPTGVRTTDGDASPPDDRPATREVPPTRQVDQPTSAAPIVASVRILGGDRAMRVGSRAPISATVFDDEGEEFDESVDWSTSDDQVAYVTGRELVARSAGSASVTAVAGGVETSIEVTVRELPTRSEVVEILQARFVDLLGRSDTDGIERLFERRARAGQPREILDRMREASFSAQLSRLGEVVADDTGATIDFDVGLVWRNAQGQRNRGEAKFQAALEPTPDGWELAGVSRLSG